MKFKATIVLLCLGLAWSSVWAAGEIQSHAAIFDAVNNFIHKSLAPAQEHEISLNNLDPRLKLESCTVPLEVFLPNQSLKAGRNSIGVRCQTGKSWSLFITAQIKIFQEVVVVTQPVKRGDILTEELLSLQKLDLGLQKTGYLTEVSAVLGKQVLHPLAANSPLNIRDFAQAVIIKRGDNVLITSGNPNVRIEMQGVAMMDAAAGQNIRVKNISSGRVIMANAIKSGVVMVDY